MYLKVPPNFGALRKSERGKETESDDESRTGFGRQNEWCFFSSMKFVRRLFFFRDG